MKRVKQLNREIQNDPSTLSCKNSVSVFETMSKICFSVFYSPRTQVSSWYSIIFLRTLHVLQTWLGKTLAVQPNVIALLFSSLGKESFIFMLLQHYRCRSSVTICQQVFRSLVSTYRYHSCL